MSPLDDLFRLPADDPEEPERPVASADGGARGEPSKLGSGSPLRGTPSTTTPSFAEDRDGDHDEPNAEIHRLARRLPAEEPTTSDEPAPPPDIDQAARGEPRSSSDMNTLIRRAAGFEPRFDIRELRLDRGVV